LLEELGHAHTGKRPEVGIEQHNRKNKLNQHKASISFVYGRGQPTLEASTSRLPFGKAL
jgi:hypothetical protein